MDNEKGTYRFTICLEIYATPFIVHTMALNKTYLLFKVRQILFVALLFYFYGCVVIYFNLLEALILKRLLHLQWEEHQLNGLKPKCAQV